MEHKEYSDKLKAKYLVIKEKSGRAFSHTKLAKAAGCSPSMITRWISGEKNPSMDLLLRIAEAVLIQQALLEGAEYRLNKMLED